MGAGLIRDADDLVDERFVVLEAQLVAVAAEGAEHRELYSVRLAAALGLVAAALAVHDVLLFTPFGR